MPNLKIAKRSAAFEAIKQLHQYKELTDNLMPLGSKKCVERYFDQYFNHWNDPKFREGNLLILSIKSMYYFLTKFKTC